MMHGDVYRALALTSIASLASYNTTSSSTIVLKTNRQAQARSHYVVMLHREESADASWLSLPTNQAQAEN